MGKTYVFVNQKGGVGKTTSAINIGAYLALDGKKTLLVDFDSQGNMTSGVGVDRNKPTVYDLLAGTAKIDTVIRKSPVPGLSVIPASIDLSGAAIELVDQKEREFYLRRALEPVKDKFDYILIDCPPSLGILTLNGLVAADEVLIPLQCEYFALEGLTLLLQTVKRVQKSLNPDLGIGGIFLPCTIHAPGSHRMLCSKLPPISRTGYSGPSFRGTYGFPKLLRTVCPSANMTHSVSERGVTKNWRKR